MAAFVNGYYPTTHGEAGMIGYVQAVSVEAWSEKLCAELTRKAQFHSVVEPWAQNRSENSEQFYSSTHQTSTGSKLLVTHLLLPFLEEQ